MTVDFDIMPDVPPEKRGLHYWANPNWLCLEKKYVEKQKSPMSRNMKKATTGVCNNKKTTLIDESGEILIFDAVKEAAEYVGYSSRGSAGLSTAMRRGEVMPSGDVRIVCFGKEYIVVKGEG